MSRPVWTWQMLGAGDVELDRPLSPTFTNRFDAEAWLGEHWRHLAGQGVAHAQLLQQGSPAAAPLPLRAG